MYLKKNLKFFLLKINFYKDLKYERSVTYYAK